MSTSFPPSAPRLGLFLDAPNIDRSVRTNSQSVFDPTSLISWARGRGFIACAHAYISARDEASEGHEPRESATGQRMSPPVRQGTSDYLSRKYNNAGFTVTMVPAGTQRKDVDTTMAVDAVKCILDNQIDVLVLASADADFVPVVDLAHAKGKLVVVAAVQQDCSSALRSRADLVVDLPIQATTIT